MEIYERSITLPHSVEDVFAWMERPSAYDRYMPPWENIETLEKVGTIRDGDFVTYQVRVGPFGIRQTLQHEGFRPLEEFGNRQTEGPHRSWVNRHLFRAVGDSSCEVTDRTYAEPSRIASLLGLASLRRRIEYIFDWTQERIRRDLERHAGGPGKPLRVLIAGASGRLGHNLAAFVGGGGHEIVKLVRCSSGAAHEISWNPVLGELDTAALEGFDVVIHLAGENLGAGRLTDLGRERIWERHVTATEVLCAAVSRLDQPPGVLVSASPVALLAPAQRTDRKFLTEVAEGWTEAAESARAAGIRVVNARLGNVLTPEGGLLRRLLPAFRMGAGARVGVGGGRPFNWIGMEDAVGALHFLSYTDEASGPVDVVAPEAVTNQEFARTLAAVLQPPALLRPVGLAIRSLSGWRGAPLGLGGEAANTGRLDGLGFDWIEPTLQGALSWELGKTPLK